MQSKTVPKQIFGETLIVLRGDDMVPSSIVHFNLSHTSQKLYKYVLILSIKNEIGSLSSSQ